MGNLQIALTIVLFMNVMMFLVQASILDLNPNGNVCTSYKGTLLQDYDGNNAEGNASLNLDKAIDELPSGNSGISIEGGNIFTDTFNSIKSWFSQKAGYVGAIVGAPYNIIQCLNLPGTFTFAIGALWYGITIFIIVTFFWRGD